MAEASRVNLTKVSEAASRARVSASPRHADRRRSWLVLSGLLLLAAFPLVIDLGRPGLIFAPEAKAMDVSVETWSREVAVADGGWSFGFVLPRSGGRPMTQTPPGLTWWHLLGLQSFSPDSATSEQIVYRLRWVSVGFALLLVAAVFWAGHAIGGLTTAGMSGLVFVATPTWIPFARLSVGLIPTLAWITLSVAAALSALGAHQQSGARFRQGLGWSVSGLSLALAVLTGGWLALFAAVLPIGAIVAIRPPRWTSGSMGLAGAVAIAGLGILAWTGYLLGHDLQPASSWLGGPGPLEPAGPLRWLTQAGWRTVLILAAVMPWSLWLIGGLVQPFSTSSKGWRERMLIGWVWFVAVVVVLLMAVGAGGVSASLIFALPPAALVVGQLFRRLIDLSGQGRHARVWRISRWPMAMFFLGLSILMPLGLYIPRGLIGSVLSDQPLVQPIHWGSFAGLTIALVAAASIGLRYCASHHPGRALVTWAIWTVIAMTALTMSFSRGPLMRPWPKDAQPREKILPLTMNPEMNPRMGRRGLAMRESSPAMLSDLQ